MAQDPFLDFTLLAEGDLNAETAVNELLARIQAGTVRVKSQTTTAQPGSPTNFDAYLLPASPTGTDWAGNGNKLAFFVDGWLFFDPKEGMRIHVEDQDNVIDYNGTVWCSDRGIQTLTDADNITWDLRKGAIAEVTIAQNRTLTNPLNLVNGRTFRLIVIQGAGGGSKTLAYGTAYKFNSGNPPALSLSAGQVDLIRFVSREDTMLFGGISKNLQ